MQCCVSMAYIGVLGSELPFTWTVAREGFCDEVVGSRDPRGEGGTDVLGESSLVGQQQMQPLCVAAEQQESGVSRWGQPGTVLCGARLPCSTFLGVPAPSHVISGSGAQLAGALSQDLVLSLSRALEISPIRPTPKTVMLQT